MSTAWLVARWPLALPIYLDTHRFYYPPTSVIIYCASLPKTKAIIPEKVDLFSKLLCGSKSYQEALRIVGVTRTPYIENLNKNNYSERFALLVDFQELQEQHQIKLYDRSNQKLTPCTSTFLLEVSCTSSSRIVPVLHPPAL